MQVKKADAYLTAIKCVIESDEVGTTDKADCLKCLYRDLSFAERREQDGDTETGDSK